MKHCMECGAKLTMKHLDKEGMVPFCPECNQFRFPVFNTACSMITLNKKKNKILLIKQYNMGFYILVAGYISKGENAEVTVAREIKEEIGLNVIDCGFNRSEYYEKSNTLMLNWYAVVDDMDLSDMDQDEVDHAKWFTFDEARKAVERPGQPLSLAGRFLHAFLDDLEAGRQI